MIVKTRVTAQGTEYWDNKAKKVLFISAGKEPNFEVTTEYKSMIVGVDLANGKDETVVTTNLESMTVAQLKEYAAANEIEIPKNVTRKEDIINLLSDVQ